MPEEIKGLIEKIQKEGIQKAQDERQKIVAGAKEESARLIEDARRQADSIIQKAKDESQKHRESVDSALRQAGRDFLISLRSQIEALLNKIISQKISESLTAQEMAKIIGAIVKEYGRKEKLDQLEVILNKGDLARLKEALLSELANRLTKGITLKPSDNISAGFTISFDSGKSHFDFSDQALAEYLSSYLHKEIAKILNPK